jgi:histone acetyltransferase MYST1
LVLLSRLPALVCASLPFFSFLSFIRYSEAGYNLACILCFPFAQRKGYGRFLMEFSYELSKKEEKVGSPEKPLSDLGALGYRSYWASTIVRFLKAYSGQYVSIMDITCGTSILADDVITTLEMLGLLRTAPNSREKKENGEVSNGNNKEDLILFAPDDILDELIIKYPENKIKVDPDKLHWTPFYIMDPKKDKWSIYSVRNSVTSTTAVTPTNSGIPKSNSSGNIAMEVA